MTSWNPVRFRELLQQLLDRTGLTQTELAQLAGRHRTQFNRWTRSENRPEFDPLARLASAVAAQHPEATDLARALLKAAGYGDRASIEEHIPDEPALILHSPAADQRPPAALVATAARAENDPFREDVGKIAMYLQKLDEERQESDRRIDDLQSQMRALQDRVERVERVDRQQAQSA